jgi:hypothetical protein
MFVFVAVKWNKGETTMKLIPTSTKPKLDPVTIEFPAREALFVRELVWKITGDATNILRKELVDKLYSILERAYPTVNALDPFDNASRLFEQKARVSDSCDVNMELIKAYLDQAN